MDRSVLIVDDVRPLAEQYAYDLERLGGFETRVALGGAEALEVLGRELIDCVILDLEMPDLDGFDVLRALDHRGIRVPVIVYTGTGSYDRCIEAVRLGAFGFIDKSEPMERVVHEVRLALRQGELEDRLEAFESGATNDSSLLGDSDAMTGLRNQIERLAPIPSPVLILGESGTGKELVARELHRASRRSGEAFVALNCGGMAEGLVDSDLFGHEKGAFTGAVKARRGAFERANAGTLFLDEIGELPGPSQARLLRVLEGGTITRLGAEEPIRVGARVLAATHRDLDRAVAEGSFRDDLLFRLNVHVLSVPPLRDRKDDIPLLVDHFVSVLSGKLGKPTRPVAPEAVSALQQRRWARNNVRELRNTIERLIIAADGPVLRLEDLPPDLDGRDGDGGEGAGPATYRAQRKAAERAIVVGALEAHEWHITRTASALGLADHSSLLKIMRKHGIRRP